MSLVVICYLICWIPITVNFIAVAVTQNRRFFHDYHPLFGFIFHTLTLIATHLNTAIDPLIYAYRIKEVREGIKKMFKYLQRVDSELSQNSATTNVTVSWFNFQWFLMVSLWLHNYQENKIKKISLNLCDFFQPKHLQDVFERSLAQSRSIDINVLATT